MEYLRGFVNKHKESRRLRQKEIEAELAVRLDQLANGYSKLFSDGQDHFYQISSYAGYKVDVVGNRKKDTNPNAPHVEENFIVTVGSIIVILTRHQYDGIQQEDIGFSISENGALRQTSLMSIMIDKGQLFPAGSEQTIAVDSLFGRRLITHSKIFKPRLLHDGINTATVLIPSQAA